MKAYEVHNPSFNDMTLEEQIEVGINDWAVENKTGHLYFGRTAKEAESIARSFENARREWAQRNGNDSGFDSHAIYG